MVKVHLSGSFVVFLCIFLTFSSGYAEQHSSNRLTRDNVTAFILDVTNKANETKSGADYDNLANFFAGHIHPKAFFKSTMRYDIPGYPNQDSSLSLDKSQYIESLTESQEMVSDYQANVKVKNVKISKDKRKATVKTINSESAVVHVPNGGTVTKVPVTGSSTCNQIIMLSSQNVMQIYSANCKTEMVFDGF